MASRREYRIVYEPPDGPNDHNWSAFVPDLPGCVATGVDRAETGRHIREAVAYHLQELLRDGSQLPEGGEYSDTAAFEVRDDGSVLVDWMTLIAPDPLVSNER